MGTVNDLVTEVKELVDGTILDAPKCDKGNRQAGIRVRKNMMAIIDTAKAVRKKVIEIRKS